MKSLLAVLLCIPLLAHAVTAKSYVVMDMDGHIITERDGDVVRPIASITKLFTAEKNLSLRLDEPITITHEDVVNGKMRSSLLREGQAYTRLQLLNIAMVNSDNIAALALGRSSTFTVALPPNTTYVEASGLNPENQSTAHSLADLARSLYLTQLGPMTMQATYSIGDKERKSTNPLLGKHNWDFFFSKTGFIDPAGGCLVVVMKVKDKLVAVALLGATSVRQRWCDLAELRTELGDSDFAEPMCRMTHENRVHKRKHRL